ncbi:MAG: sigma-70 family RNA polymerase sigma factor [Firmicutes bacterium]|jgi:RNA polymerase sporulation-specific sigma factor|nr:sigma-70 family RNA polymerase sigma factor [Bacillota bacterium]
MLDPEREAVVRRHAGLVMNLARRFAGRAELADLFQAGCVGLLRALDGYDPSRGFAFSTYAVPSIVSEIRAYLRGKGPTHIPRPVRELGGKCLAAQDSLRAELMREPSVAEIAARVGVGAAEVALALESEAPAVSIYETVSSDSESPPILDLIPGPAAPDASVIDSVALRDALRSLPEVQRSVIAMRFFREMTQTEIAASLGMSQPQVHRIEKAALHALRRHMQCE